MSYLVKVLPGERVEAGLGVTMQEEEYTISALKMCWWRSQAVTGKVLHASSYLPHSAHVPYVLFSLLFVVSRHEYVNSSTNMHRHFVPSVQFFWETVLSFYLAPISSWTCLHPFLPSFLLINSGAAFICLYFLLPITQIPTCRFPIPFQEQALLKFLSLSCLLGWERKKKFPTHREHNARQPGNSISS